MPEAIARGRNQVCHFCGEEGATLGCNVSTCKMNYHVICAIRANCRFSIRGNENWIHCYKHGIVAEGLTGAQKERENASSSRKKKFKIDSDEDVESVDESSSTYDEEDILGNKCVAEHEQHARAEPQHVVNRLQSKATIEDDMDVIGDNLFGIPSPTHPKEENEEKQNEENEKKNDNPLEKEIDNQNQNKKENEKEIEIEIEMKKPEADVKVENESNQLEDMICDELNQNTHPLNEKKVEAVEGEENATNNNETNNAKYIHIFKTPVW